MVDDLLRNVELMRGMLYNGRTNGGKYGQAMQLYNFMVPSIDEDIIEHL